MPMTPKEMISFLQKAGYVILSQNGSHVKMRNQDSGRTVVQRPEKGIGAGNIETGGAEIALPPEMEVIYGKVILSGSFS